MHIDEISRKWKYPARADQAAVGAINDSVGKGNFAGMRHLFRAKRGVGNPQLRGENALFSWYLSPLFAFPNRVINRPLLVRQASFEHFVSIRSG
jgi:hypothetical protein